jgi:hypothetical protein
MAISPLLSFIFFSIYFLNELTGFSGKFEYIDNQPTMNDPKLTGFSGMLTAQRH